MNEETERQKFDRLVSEAIASKGCELFDFEGKNCDECPGWDGISRRCECGNRRVCWQLSYYGDYVYGEAW